MEQKKIGIIISYINLLVGTIINIFLTPMLIRHLGDVDYSIYKVMQSFAGPLVIFNLGISTIVTRSIVRFHTEEKYTLDEKKNTLALSIVTSIIMGMIVIGIGICMRFFIPTMYSNTYNVYQIKTAQDVFLFFVLSTVFHILTDAFSGCIVGNEKYAIHSSVALAKNIMKIVFLIIMLNMGCDVVAIVLVDLIIAIIIFLFSVIYSIWGLNEKPRLSYIDKKQLAEIFSFSVAILLQAIVNQVNNNMDTMILGAYIDDKSIITMYSSALTIYMMYNSLVSVVSGFFLPKATKLISRKSSGKVLTDFVIEPGRFNAIIAIAVIFSFLLFGENFIEIWIGRKYIEAYYVTLMLIIPVTIPLVENVVISILDASLKRIYRSIVLVFMCIINLIVSVILIQFMSFWGAVIGTVFSLIIGHGFLMNWYYAKVFDMEIVRMFKSIFKGIFTSGLFAMILCIPVSVYLPNTLIFFVIKCFFYIFLYGIFLWKKGMNETEKTLVMGLVKKINKIRGL